MMRLAKKGDRVKIHYTAKLEDENAFSSTWDDEPFEFVIGEMEVLSGLQNAVTGMSTGETKTIMLKPEEAFGDVRTELIFEVDRNQFPEDRTLKNGETISINIQEGHTIDVTIADQIDNKVVLDANHPLAGKSIIFDFEVIDVQ